MPKFKISIGYHSVYNAEVEAMTEEDAVARATTVTNTYNKETALEVLKAEYAGSESILIQSEE